MGVLDTFFIEFRTNQATAEQEIKKIDKQMDALAAKGKKSNDEDIKAQRELFKRRQELTDQIKAQRDAVERLGDTVTDLASGFASAFGAYAITNGIRKGILDVTNFNSALDITATRTGASVEQLRKLDAFFEAGGAKKGSFVQLYSSAFASQAGAGLPTGDPEALIRQIRKTVLAQGSPQAQELAFQRFGIPFDEATKARILASDKDFEKWMQTAAKNARNSAESYATAREFEQRVSEAGSALDQIFTNLADLVLPYFSTGLEYATKILNQLADSKLISGLGALAAVLGGSWLTGSALKGASRVAGALGAGRAAAATGLLAEGVAGAGLLVIDATAAGEIGTAIGDVLTGKRESYLGKGADWVAGKIDSWWNGDATVTKGNYGNVKKRAYDAWIAKGYSPAQASALVGNMLGESGTNPNAVGDNGTAFGIAQWHNNRAYDIYKNTGINVRSSSATLEDQIAAQDWEMRNRFGINPNTLPNDPSAGADFLVKHYEFSANQAQDAITRAQYAQSVASQFSFQNTPSGGDQTVNVSVQNVNVQTQATDAKGISQDAAAALKNELRNTFSNFDDGVQG